MEKLTKIVLGIGLTAVATGISMKYGAQEFVRNPEVAKNLSLLGTYVSAAGGFIALVAGSYVIDKLISQRSPETMRKYNND